MGILRDQWILWIGVASSAVTALILAILAPDKVRAAFLALLRRWMFLLIVAALVVFLYVLPRWYDPWTHFEGSILARWIRRWYWAWMLLVLLGALVSVMWLRRVVGTAGLSWRTGGPLDQVWQAMLARLSQSRVDLSRQRVHLVLTPDAAGQARADALIPSSDLRLVCEAPDGPALVGARVISSGVLLTCDGGWAEGLNGPGPLRVEDLGRKLTAWGPDRPLLTGVTLVLPLDWAASPGAADQAAVAGEEIQILYHTLKVRCPVTVVVPALETLPGMSGFVRRVAAVDPKRLSRRAGFEVPASRTLNGKVARDAMEWIAGWFHSNVLALLKAAPDDTAGNASLVRFDHHLRKVRSRLAKILDVALSPRAEGDEPVRVAGGYFTAATGRPETSAFAAGLFQGRNPPLLASERSREWTESAMRADATYRRLAIGLAIVVVSTSAALLAFLVRPRLPSLGWSGLIGLVVLWFVGLVLPWNRWRMSVRIYQESSE